MGFSSETRTTVKVVCDGPKCPGKGKEGGPTTLTWIDEDVKKDPNTIPDDFFRFLQVGIPMGAVLNFCSVQCVRDALRVYVPPLSPREKAVQDKHNAEVEAKKGGLQLVPHPQAVQKMDGGDDIAQAVAGDASAEREAAIAENTVINPLPAES